VAGANPQQFAAHRMLRDPRFSERSISAVAVAAEVASLLSAFSQRLRRGRSQLLTQFTTNASSAAIMAGS
jgi:hypothetical protein